MYRSKFSKLIKFILIAPIIGFLILWIIGMAVSVELFEFNKLDGNYQCWE